MPSKKGANSVPSSVKCSGFPLTGAREGSRSPERAALRYSPNSRYVVAELRATRLNGPWNRVCRDGSSSAFSTRSRNGVATRTTSPSRQVRDTVK